MRHLFVVKHSFLGVVIFTATIAPAVEFRAVQLQKPAIPGGFLPQALGESGLVVGDALISGESPTRPVYWNVAGAPTLVPLPAGASGGSAFGIGQNDFLTGYVRYVGEDYGRAAVFNVASGEWTIFASGSDFGVIVDVENGVYVGDVGVLPNVGQNAAIWSGSGFQTIPGLPKFISTIRDINSSGKYTGITIDDANPNDWVYGGFVGENGAATALSYASFPETRSFEINNAGWITGIWSPDGETRRGYVAREEEIRDLGLFSGFAETWVPAINNDNTIVGGASNFGAFQKALIWPNGALTPQDLNLMVDLPGVTLIRGMDINDAGQILAEGRFATGGFGYFVLTPIPEPAMAVGAASLLVLRRARRVR